MQMYVNLNKNKNPLENHLFHLSKFHLIYFVIQLIFYRFQMELSNLLNGNKFVNGNSRDILKEIKHTDIVALIEVFIK